MSQSLYVHVPFCVVKCGYCDFNSYVVEDEQAHDRFLDALAVELAQRWPRAERPVSVFVAVTAAGCRCSWLGEMEPLRAISSLLVSR